jgi:hypothetical protein
MKLDATILGKRFNSFSHAFQYIVDITELNHSEIYSKIDMNKSHWSKIYNGEIDIPQRSTRNKLNKVLGVAIKKDKKGWYLAEKNDQIINFSVLTKEQDVTTKTIGIDSMVQSKKEKIKEILIIARELEKNSNIALSDRSTTPDQKNQELTLILKILIKRFNKIMDDLEL